MYVEFNMKIKVWKCQHHTIEIPFVLCPASVLEAVSCSRAHAVVGEREEEAVSKYQRGVGIGVILCPLTHQSQHKYFSYRRFWQRVSQFFFNVFFNSYVGIFSFYVQHRETAQSSLPHDISQIIFHAPESTEEEFCRT